jgi:hypothetical protein
LSRDRLTQIEPHEDPKGNVLFTSPLLNLILKIAPDGTLTILAANGLGAHTGDGGLARVAAVLHPVSVQADSPGNAYISGSDRIRKIGSDGSINGVISGYSGDGGPVIAAQLSHPLSADADAKGDKSLSGSAQFTGGLNKNANPPPVVAPGGVLHAASYQLQGPLAPDSLISIFGSLLAQGAVSAPALPLISTLGGTTVTIAGRSLPLLYTGPDQVNAMIPYDLPINAAHQAIVQRGTAISIPQPIGVLSSQAGVFTKDLTGKGAGIAVRVTADGTQSVVSTDDPTHVYEALVIYCVGPLQG